MAKRKTKKTALAPGEKYTQEFRQSVLDHYKEFGPTAAAKKFEVPLSTVSSWVRKANARTHVKENNRAATEAYIERNRERRAKLAEDLLTDAERLRKQIWEPHTYFDWGGKDHDFDEHTTSEPTPVDKLKLMQTASTALDQATKLLQSTEDTRSEAHSVMDKLIAALQQNPDA